MILAIPIPMLWKLQVRLSKKLAIGLLLCSGLFVIAAAIIRAVLTLGSTPSGLNINRWGVRETIVGIITVNSPILRPMFNRNFWSRSSFKDSRGTEETAGWTSRNSRAAKYGKGTFELRSRANSDKEDAGIEIESNGSQENIIKKSFDGMHFGSGDVVVQTTYHVQSHDRDDEPRSVGAQRSDGYQSNITSLNKATRS
jgi:hypothetical protein